MGDGAEMEIPPVMRSRVAEVMAGRIVVPGATLDVPWDVLLCVQWLYRETLKGFGRFDRYQVVPDPITVHVFTIETADWIGCDVVRLGEILGDLEAQGVITVEKYSALEVVVRLDALSQMLGVIYRREQQLRIAQSSESARRRPRVFTYSRRMADLISRFDARCHYCRRPGTQGSDPDESAWTKDHVRPQILGGSNHPDNLVLACRMCNSTKGDRPVAWLMKWLEKKGLPDFQIPASRKGLYGGEPTPSTNIGEYLDDGDIPF